MNLSIVIPLYNEDESLPELAAWIQRVMEANNYSYEVLFMDDGSKDRSWAVIEDLHSNNPSFKGIKFRRNYGKSAALNVGFAATKGNVVITMDADLQDSPDEIPALYNRIMNGADVVSGWKQKRYDPITKTIPTKLFNWATRKMSGINNLHDFNCGLKAYRADVIKSIEVYGEMHRYIPVLAKWAGFENIEEQVVEHRARKYGVTKFGWERFINGFLDLLSIFFMGKFGKKPMHFFGLYGFLAILLGFGISLYLIADKLINLASGIKIERQIIDQPLFYIALTMVVVGVQLFLAGFIGELVSRNSADRNDYLIQKSLS